MRQHYLIEVAPSDQLVVFCPRAILENKTLKKISFGSRSLAVKFYPHPDCDDRIIISQYIQEALQFPSLSLPLHVFCKNEQLTMGPLVGVFTSGFTTDKKLPIGERTEFFSKLLSVQKMTATLPFVFGEEHIDWEQGCIDGMFFVNQTWQKHSIPFPDVIYDRIPNRRSESRAKIKKVKERLQTDYLIPWYNPGFFNKLDVYERLQQDASVENYLPETHPFTSFSMIEHMLAQYGHVYIKPKNGSLGLGIHQVIYDKQTNEYYCRYQEQGIINRLRKFSTLESLFDIVFSNQQLEKMVVQQGIHLLRHEQKMLDFRVHTNKDEQGKWLVTAIAAKIAGSGSVTTHLRSGGVIKTLEELFSREESAKYTHKLSTAALDLSRALAENMEGIIGEIGFDLGLDRHGNVWLFEANSKPGRSIFTHPDLQTSERLTRKLSIAFAVFLAEKAIVHPEELYR
ncbi:YheC/YheD family protein [Bacillus rubiinfantis]|uniref:YheC/YheD family endospore coat-associated protein n=1 Tax=Bacillus rubiinfantis TaxID=1499680 RepID=UPI0005A7C4CC|nr:YheC/YheD family protein [Bacillus rubiinfantis]